MMDHLDMHCSPDLHLPSHVFQLRNYGFSLPSYTIVLCDLLMIPENNASRMFRKDRKPSQYRLLCYLFHFSLFIYGLCKAHLRSEEI